MKFLTDEIRKWEGNSQVLIDMGWYRKLGRH